MNEERINQIVQRILADPALQGLLQRAGCQTNEPTVKSEALVLLNYVPDFPRLFKALARRWGAGYTLKLLPSDQVFLAKPQLPEGMSWISVAEAMAKTDWAKFILPACSANTLAKAALGIRDNPISEMIGRGISRGCSVELVTEYQGLTEQTPPAYRELYEGYIQKLQTCGVNVWAALGDEQPLAGPSPQARPSPPGQLNLPGQTGQSNQSGQLSQSNRPGQAGQPSPPASAAAEFRSKPGDTREDSAPRRIRYTKKFLGDKQAWGFPEGTAVIIPGGTVISPLARDTLRLRRIELCMEKEAGR